jgi:putative two-component system response regulator
MREIVERRSPFFILALIVSGSALLFLLVEFSSAFAGQRPESIGAGMDDFVYKPYGFNEIYQCMSKRLGVRYIYDRAPEPEQATAAEMSKILFVLPEALSSDLTEALESLETNRMAQVIQQIATCDRKLQKILSQLALLHGNPESTTDLLTSPMTNKGRILAVDDTPASLKLLSEILNDEGYEVRAAINGRLALHAAIDSPPELILLDIRMPDMDGFEVCRQLKAHPKTCDIPVIFVSAISETGEKVQGFELGAVDFVTKPYQREELLARVRTHLEVDRLRNHLEDLVEERTRELRGNLLDFVTAIGATIEVRDPYTAGHQRRVAHLATAIAKELRMTEDQILGLKLASVVHDIGKIRVPAEILSKPGRLDQVEFDLIKRHPVTGYEILKSINFPWPIADVVLQHHERLDGSGYPSGLKAEEILHDAKIVAVADVVEAMVSHRPYRAGLGVDAAMEEIIRNRGLIYDSVVVDVCVKLFREQGYTLPV